MEQSQMPRGIPDASNILWVEGQSISIDFDRTSSTAGTVKWTLPASPKIYNGILILASPKEINPSNYPTDGVHYTASSNLATPGDKIGSAFVIGAFYDDMTTVEVSVTGLVADAPYYFTAHVVTNVLTYYTFGVKSYSQTALNGAFAGDVDKSFGPPENPTIGKVYYDFTQKMLFVWTGDVWQPTSATTVITDIVDPVPGQAGLPSGYPGVGDFFYNITQKMLKTWNGTQWNSTEGESGVPSYQKQGVGTDLNYGPRVNLIDILKKQLGYPVVCVELIEDHFNIAIDNALQELRRRTDVAYHKEYFFMQLMRFQDVYYLNDPSTGTDKIVDVLKIHRLNMLGFVNFAPDNIYAQQFLNQFYAPGVGYDLVSIHLVHAMSETYTQLFAGDVAYNWREASRELKLYRKFGSPEKVLLECSCEKPEQELLVDRWVQQWIQQWAESELMLILAHIRGKFTTLPGPGGGLSLNADTLISQAQSYQEDCLRQIKDFEVGQNGPDNFYSPFVIG
jgi:hypothetical protein